MGKKKKPLEKPAPEPKEIILDALVQFCADNGVDGATFIASLSESWCAESKIDDKLKFIRVTTFYVADWEGIPTQRSCLYQTLVKYWLPEAAKTHPEIGNDPEAFLKTIGIENPDALENEAH